MRDISILCRLTGRVWACTSSSSSWQNSLALLPYQTRQQQRQQHRKKKEKNRTTRERRPKVIIDCVSDDEEFGLLLTSRPSDNGAHQPVGGCLSSGVHARTTSVHVDRLFHIYLLIYWERPGGSRRHHHQPSNQQSPSQTKNKTKQNNNRFLFDSKTHSAMGLVFIAR